MSPTEVTTTGDREIVEMLVNLKPGSHETVTWPASVIADPAKVEGVSSRVAKRPRNRSIIACHGPKGQVLCTSMVDASWQTRLHRLNCWFLGRANGPAPATLGL